MGDIRLLLLDVDGVLTNGRVYVTHEGHRFKAFHSRDNRAIAEFAANGWEVHLITASGWSGLHGYCKNMPVITHINSPKTAEQLADITQGAEYIACGDDCYDLVMLEGASHAYCPKDADESVLSRPDVTVLNTAGGHGVVAELARTILGRYEVG